EALGAGVRGPAVRGRGLGDAPAAAADAFDADLAHRAVRVVVTVVGDVEAGVVRDVAQRRRTEAALPVRRDVIGERLGAHHVEGRAGARRVGALVALGPGPGAVQVVEGDRAGVALGDGDGPGGRRAGREQRSARRRELLDGVA